MLLIDMFPFILMRTVLLVVFFFFNDTATTEIYTLSLHDALPICQELVVDWDVDARRRSGVDRTLDWGFEGAAAQGELVRRSEEHTSELQSRQYLVCRLLLEKKKIKTVVSSSTVSKLTCRLQSHMY